MLSNSIGSWYHPNAKKPLFKSVYLCRVKNLQGNDSDIYHIDMKWDGHKWCSPFELSENVKLSVVGWKQNKISQLRLSKS